ncbi:MULTISPECIES: roadblock/LC7 domain-containing protein [unclassified Streptomyces]|uniref:roadblock/LC7 domain-containing protein n=1 Tax=unclassified Streptomyces TaxID=2593676 RepID=UPI0033333C69
MTQNTTTPQQGGVQSMEWLLNDLLGVPGVIGALLAAQDGLKLAYTRQESQFAEQGFDLDTADRVASVISGMYALTNGMADMRGGTARDLQLGVLKHKDWTLYAVSAGKGVPEGTPLGPGRRPVDIECTLGVLTSPGADEGAIGFEMRKLVQSMDRHLRTPARRPEPGVTDGQ